MENSKEKIRSTIFGAAVGDAMGLMTEFMTKEEVYNHYGKIKKVRYDDFIKDGHRSTWMRSDGLGDWTDDTDQLLLIIKTLLESNGKSVDVVFANKLIEWIDKGLPECGDMHGCGSGTTTSLWWGDRYSTTNPHMAALRSFIYHPFKSCKSESNGGVMRTSVIGLLPDIDEVVDYTIKICSATHASPKCVAASLFVTVLVHEIVYNNKLYDIFDLVLNKIKGHVTNYTNHFNSEIHSLAKCIENDDEYKMVIQTNYTKNFTEYDPENIMSELYEWVNMESLDSMNLNKDIGYTFKPVACACYAIRQFLNGKTFEKTMVEILSEGGDADTNCCVAGAVFGSLISYDDLPNYEKNNLAYSNVLDSYISKFQDFVCKN